MKVIQNVILKEFEKFKSALLCLYFKADFKTICGNIPGFTFDIHTGKAVGEFFQIMFVLIHTCIIL